MNGVVIENENAGINERRSAVEVGGAARWSGDADRLSSYPATGDRSSLIRAHAAKSVECAPASPRGRRAPRESRRVSLAQAAGYVQLNQYRLLEPIGQGSYGIVKLAYNEEDDTHYAMKILSKRKLMRRAGLFGRTPPRKSSPGPPPDPLQRVYREIAVLKKLDHPNVVKLVEVLDDPAEDQLYLVFQLLEGGPVVDIPTDRPLSEDVARRYFRDVLLGVEYLHYQGIAHRDLKPANLLLGEERVQVADLGACGELAGRLSGAVGTPAFRAPEATASTDNYGGEAADIWSLGVTLYAMVTGRVPWAGSSAAELQQRVVADPLAYPRALPSKQLRHLFSRMLEKDPAKRATMHEIKEHEWVTAGGREPLPSEQENCRLVEVTEEDMARVVTSIPNLSTLILIKTMLKKHSFQNPFLRSREGSAARRESVTPRGGGGEPAGGGGGGVAAGGSGRRGGLARAGRSLSAPGSYLTERQASFDVALESVQEGRDQSQDIPPVEDASATNDARKMASTSQSAVTSQSVGTSKIASVTQSDATSQSDGTHQSAGNSQSADTIHSTGINQSAGIKQSAGTSHSASTNQSKNTISSVTSTVDSKSVSRCQSVSDVQSSNSSQDVSSVSDLTIDAGKTINSSHSFRLNQTVSPNQSINKCVTQNDDKVKQSQSDSQDKSSDSVSKSGSSECKMKSER